MSEILVIHASDANPILKAFRSVFEEERVLFLNIEHEDAGQLRSVLRAASYDTTLCLIFSSERLIDSLKGLSVPRADWIDRYLLVHLGILSIQINLTKKSRVVRFLHRDLFHAVHVWPGRPLLEMHQSELKHTARSLHELALRAKSLGRSLDFNIRLEARPPLSFSLSPRAFWPETDPRIVELLFATNRAPIIKWDAVLDFGKDRTDALNYGACRVRVPEDHRIGRLELPKKTSWLKLRFKDEEIDEQRHFAIRQIAVFDHAEFCEIIRSDPFRTALVFVHGFNTTFRDGVFRLAQIVWDMQFRSAPILFSWPSAGEILDYLYDMNSALGARPRFQELIRMLRDEAGVETIHIIAHSMGNFVVLEALNELAKAGTLPGLAEIVMAAPDVDVDVYKTLASNVRPLTRGMTLYASANDKALVASRKAAGKPRAGDVFSGCPILLPGIESIDVSVLGAEMFGLNHNVFATDRSLIDDIGRLVLHGWRPPDRRSPQIRGVPEGIVPPQYWRYAP